MRNLVVAVTCLTAIHSAHAGTIVCEGTVEELAMHQPGLIKLRLSSMNDSLFICNVSADYQPAGAMNIPPAACKTIYAGLLATKYNKATVRSVYFDGDQAPASCNAVQPGSQVYLRYFIL